MTISNPITALVASMMLLNRVTASSIWEGTKLEGFNLFTMKLTQDQISTMTVGGRIATKESSSLSSLDVGGQLARIETCPSPHAACPLEELIKMDLWKETVYYSNDVPQSIVSTKVTVRNGVAYHYGSRLYDDDYKGLPGWTFDDGCGPNKIFNAAFIDFASEYASAKLISRHLNPEYDPEVKCTEWKDGFFCHDNKLIVIPNLADHHTPAGKRPVVRYSLTCAQFNDLENYEIYDRNNGDNDKPILSFTFDGNADGKCIIKTGLGDKKSIFDGYEDRIVWNYIGLELHFNVARTFFGSFILAGENGGQMTSSLSSGAVVIFNGQVIAEHFISVPAVINLKPLLGGLSTTNPVPINPPVSAQAVQADESTAIKLADESTVNDQLVIQPKTITDHASFR
jgi:hypothetical protein